MLELCDLPDPEPGALELLSRMLTSGRIGGVAIERIPTTVGRGSVRYRATATNIEGIAIVAGGGRSPDAAIESLANILEAAQ